MGVTLVIHAESAVFFALGKVRSDIVALCALICLMLFGILTPQEALSGFSNSVVIMMIGLFVVGGAVFQTGLARMMGGKIMGMAGNSELRLFLLVMLVTAGIGAFVSNTGTVALMLPIVVSLAASAKMSASRLLMPLAFASCMCGYSDGPVAQRWSRGLIILWFSVRIRAGPPQNTWSEVIFDFRLFLFQAQKSAYGQIMGK